MAAKFNPPKEFDFLPENWPEWISRWSRFRTVSKLNTEEEGVQIDSLIYSMGTRAESIFSSLGLGEDEVGVYNAVKQAFEEYFASRRYIIYERAKFFRRVQAEGESVEQFIRALNESADRCEFPDRATQIRDRKVVGMRDQTVSREMQRMDIDLLTEAKAVSMARQAEEVERQMRELTLPKSVDEVKPSRRRKPRVAPSSHQSNTKSSNSDRITELSGPCSRCGHSKHYNGKCPAIDRKCNVCSMLGRYGSCCRSKSSKPKKARVNQLVTDASFLGEVDSNSDSWTQLVVVEGLELPVRFKLDSGADVSVGPSRLCGNVTVRPTSKRLIAPGNMYITVLGEFDSVLRVGSRKHTELLYVVDQTNALLGREACVKLGLITCHVSDVNTNDFSSEFKEMFQGLGHVSEEYDVQLQPDARPFAIFISRNVPYPLVDKVKAELDQMLAQKVIFAVDQPTDWCAPMVVVPKGDKVRICVDYTELNKVVRRNVHPMSDVETSLAKLGAGTVFTKLDANSGFWQIPLSEKSKLLTTFLTPHGRYAFNRLPFGLTSSPEIFFEDRV